MLVMTGDPVTSKNKAHRAGLLASIIAHGENTEMPETTPEAKIMFWESFQLNVGNLKDIYSDSTDSCSRKSSSSSSSVASLTTEITTPPKVIDIKNMSRVRLLANTSTLEERVAETRQTSPVAKHIFLEAIKLEIKTLKDLDENGYLRHTEKGEEQEQEESAVPTSTPTSTPTSLQKHASTTTYKEVAASDDCCTATKSIHSHSSPSTSAIALYFTPPSSPQNDKEKKTTTATKTATSSVGKHKSWRSLVHSFASLRRFVPLLASPTHSDEWLRSSQPMQDTGVMEMVFYLTSNTTTVTRSQEGACTIRSKNKNN
mmetsp:Transcript_22487/g.47205  ORF Transcript_22487/g.47205 Transcript_22487/m.47205 type:complete len:315 (-) Transcript_22487:61-1005(-)